jgi:Amt family ammonium transporter
MLSEFWIFGAASLLLAVGYALVQSGVSRAKNAASSLFRGVAQICIGIISFWAVGAAILIGSRKALLDYGGVLNASALLPIAIVLMTCAIVSGAILERSRTAVCFAATMLMAGIITPLAWHLARSNWLIQLGFIDLAGASFVHFSAGLAATVAALMVGPRTGKYNRDGSVNIFLGHSVTLVSTGVLLILVGWIPYIAGSTLAVAWDALGRSVINTVLGGGAGACAAMLYSRLRYGKFDILLLYAGLLGGLVATTAGADRMATALAVLSGAIAGLIVPMAVVWLEMNLRIDDPAGGIAVHGIGGLWALLAAALFSGGTGAEHLHRIGAAAVAAASIGALTTALALTTFLLLRLSIGLRVSEADELEGLDLAEHDVNAYPDFQQTSIKSYHLREM